MNEAGPPYCSVRIQPADAAAGFACGDHALDDFFARHAFANDSQGVGRAYVLHRQSGDDPTLPAILGFYTLSMASAESSRLSVVLAKKLPRYPMPVALIGRLAVDERAQGRRLGERLLIDALMRIVDASVIVGCIGVIVDAKNERAAGFYAAYDFVDLVEDVSWPKRMFLSIATARAAVEP